jgi:hypothetical protein
VRRRSRLAADARRQSATAAFHVDWETKLYSINPTEYLYAAIVAADRGVALLPWEFANAREAVVANPSSP